GARVGDAVVLTKGVPLEGAAIIAREKEAELRARGVAPATIRRARNFLRAPGLSVLPEVEIACELAPVHAMHDPTEGGVATALVADRLRPGRELEALHGSLRLCRRSGTRIGRSRSGPGAWSPPRIRSRRSRASRR